MQKILDQLQTSKQPHASSARRETFGQERKLTRSQEMRQFVELEKEAMNTAKQN
jgi:hypothetical protein